MRSAWGTSPTDRQFTGQLSVGLGAIDFGGGTRLYSPLFGRFLSADTIVPSTGNPQALNRYAYVYNRPTVLVDPTGHDPWWNNDVQPYVDIYVYNVNFNFDSGFWTADGLARATDEIDNLAANLKGACGQACNGMRQDEVFRKIFGSIDFIAQGTGVCNASGAGKVVCGGGLISGLDKPSGRGLITHEVGHKFDYAIGRGGRAAIRKATIKDANGNFVTGVNPATGNYERTQRQYLSTKFGDMQHPASSGYDSAEGPQGEEFADMYMAWNLGLFKDGLAGQAAQTYMDLVMPGFVALAVSAK